MHEQHSLLFDELRREPRWVTADCGFVHIDADCHATVFHAGSPQLGTYGLRGGCALGAPVVYGGVHEFNFSLDSLPDDAPMLGLQGEQQCVGCTTTWTCALNLADGHVYSGETSATLEELMPSQQLDVSQVPCGCTKHHFADGTTHVHMI